jgi:hypothetical protein
MRGFTSTRACRLVVVAQLLLLVGAAGAISACTGDDERAGETPGTRAVSDAQVVEDAGPIHVHALGVNPKDGSLFIATHTGLFRSPGPGTKPRRVAGRYQDTMGFTVVGDDHFLASGHPDGREKLPPFLGLIESTDAGRTWEEVSLQGSMDFHVLEVAGRRVYGFGSDWETRQERLLVSDDRGESWLRRAAPEPLIDLAIAPGEADMAMAAGAQGLYLTRDAGRRWSALPARPGLLTWHGRQVLAVDQRGIVRAATGGFMRWPERGRVGGEPAALAAGPGRSLYVALHDGSIKRSTDGGASWAAWGTRGRRREEGAARADNTSPSTTEPVNRSHKRLRDVPGEAKAK